MTDAPAGPRPDDPDDDVFDDDALADALLATFTASIPVQSAPPGLFDDEPSAPAAAAEPESEPVVRTEPVAETEPAAEAEVEPEDLPEPVAAFEPAAATESEDVPEPVAEPDAESADAPVAAEPEVAADGAPSEPVFSEGEPAAEVEWGAPAEAEADQEPEPVAEADPEAETQPETEAEPEAVAEPEAEPVTDAEAAAEPTTPWWVPAPAVADEPDAADSAEPTTEDAEPTETVDAVPTPSWWQSSGQAGSDDTAASDVEPAAETPAVGAESAADQPVAEAPSTPWWETPLADPLGDPSDSVADLPVEPAGESTSPAESPEPSGTAEAEPVAERPSPTVLPAEREPEPWEFAPAPVPSFTDAGRPAMFPPAGWEAEQAAAAETGAPVDVVEADQPTTDVPTADVPTTDEPNAEVPDASTFDASEFGAPEFDASAFAAPDAAPDALAPGEDGRFDLPAPEDEGEPLDLLGSDRPAPWSEFPPPAPETLESDGHQWTEDVGRPVSPFEIPWTPEQAPDFSTSIADDAAAAQAADAATDASAADVAPSTWPSWATAAPPAQEEPVATVADDAAAEEPAADEPAAEAAPAADETVSTESGPDSAESWQPESWEPRSWSPDPQAGQTVDPFASPTEGFESNLDGALAPTDPPLDDDVLRSYGSVADPGLQEAIRRFDDEVQDGAQPQAAAAAPVDAETVAPVPVTAEPVAAAPVPAEPATDWPTAWPTPEPVAQDDATSVDAAAQPWPVADIPVTDAPTPETAVPDPEAPAFALPDPPAPAPLSDDAAPTNGFGDLSAAPPPDPSAAVAQHDVLAPPPAPESAEELPGDGEAPRSPFGPPDPSTIAGTNAGLPPLPVSRFAPPPTAYEPAPVAEPPVAPSEPAEPAAAEPTPAAWLVPPVPSSDEAPLDEAPLDEALGVEAPVEEVSAAEPEPAPWASAPPPSYTPPPLVEPPASDLFAADAPEPGAPADGDATEPAPSGRRVFEDPADGLDTLPAPEGPAADPFDPAPSVEQTDGGSTEQPSEVGGSTDDVPVPPIGVPADAPLADRPVDEAPSADADPADPADEAPSDADYRDDDDGSVDEGDRADGYDSAFPLTVETTVLPPAEDAATEARHAEEAAAAAAAAAAIVPVTPGVLPVEPSGAEPTPLDRRAGRSARMFWLWFGVYASVLSVAVGALVAGLGLSLRQAIVAILAGVAVSFLPLGLTTLAGKWSGQPTMIVSRATFGWFGNLLPAVVALLSRLFWAGALLWLGSSAAAGIADGLGIDGGTVGWIGFAVAAVLVFLLAVTGYGLLARAQLVLAVLSGLATVAVIALTAGRADLTAALTVPDGPWILVVGGAAMVFAVVGSAWAHSGADLARYQHPGGRGSSTMLWATVGATLPAFALITWGAVLAVSDPTFGVELLADPSAALTSVLPGWFPVPLLVIVLLNAVSGAAVSAYSAGFALQSLGAPLVRYQATAIAVLPAVLIGGLLLAAGGGAGLVQDLAVTLAVPTAAWAGLFGAEMMIRSRRFHTPSLLQRGRIYPDLRVVNTVAFVVITVVGLGLTSAASPALDWQGYLYRAVGLTATDPVVLSDLGVFAALLLGLIVPLATAVPTIREQESARSLD